MYTQAPSYLIRILSRFTYAQKFLLVSILFAFSLLVSSYFMIRSQNMAIRFTQIEIKGNIYEKALRKLIENIPQHNWLSFLYLSGNTNLEGKKLNVSTEIDADFKYLIDIDQELQYQLATTSHDFEQRDLFNIKPQEIKNQWEELSKELPSFTPAQSLAIHEQLLHNLYLLMLHIGESSNLILDPTVEANYFMEALIYNIPINQIRIPNMVVVAASLFNSKDKVKNKDALRVLTAFLEENLKTTREDFHKGFLEEKNVHNDIEIEEKLKELLTQYLNNAFDLITYTREKIIDPETPTGNINDYSLLATKTLDSSFNLWDSTIEEFDKILKTRISKYRTEQYISIFATLLSALIGFLLGILIMREISRPLSNLIKATKYLSEGDLSTRVPIDYEDEVGQVGMAFNQMAESFQELIGKLQWTGIQLTTSTTEIAAAAKQQELSTLQQGTTTKQIAVTAREITTTAKDLAKTMNEVNNTAEQTSAFASSGKAGLSQMEVIMRQMVDASQNIAGKLAILNEKVGNITTVFTTIAKVADQTNLLSLNAAIEAEKAGEHGRTFAVIAREIRRLADQTGNATLDIEKMVTEMLSAVSAGVMSVDKFSEEIHSGVGQVSMVGEQLSKIIEQVEQQTESFEDVNKGMQALSLGSEQINDSIIQLSDSAQQASQSIQQFHNTMEQLTTLAQDMQKTVSKIKR